MFYSLLFIYFFWGVVGGVAIVMIIKTEAEAEYSREHSKNTRVACLPAYLAACLPA
jgi:hypothetical protein